MKLVECIDIAVEELSGTYRWFLRGENRFKYIGSGFGFAYLNCCLFDAFDEGYTEISDYIRNNNLVVKQFSVTDKLTKDYIQKYNQDRTKRLSKRKHVANRIF